MTLHQHQYVAENGTARVHIVEYDGYCQVRVYFEFADGRRSKSISVAQNDIGTQWAAYVMTETGTLRVPYVKEN